MLDERRFARSQPDARYTVRALTGADRAAFGEFLARCAPDDRDDADICLEQQIPFGVFDWGAFVAAA